VAPPDGLFAEAARKVKLDKNEKQSEEEKKRQQREKEEQEMRKREEEMKRLQEEEERRRREEEEEEELRQERARLEEQVKHARKIESASKELTEKILEECMEEMCQEVAEDEIGAHRKFVENLQIALEEIIQETMDELTERMVCEETWRKVVREKIQRRNIISNTPIWLPSQPLEQQVEGFRHPHQEETIQLKSRYLRGVPDDFNLDRDPMDPLVVSIPGTGEETPGFPAYISKWLEEIFLRTTEQREKNVVFVEQQPVRNAQETLAVSVQAIHGRDMLKEDKTGFDGKKDIAHGIVFFMTVGNIENSLRRLEDLCDNLSTSEDIPVAIIVYNGHSMTPEEIERELNVTEQPQISAHIVKIYDENRLKNKTSLGTIFRDCLKFCARQYNFNVRLEMGRTSVFLDETLGSIFWKRLHLSAQVNPKLAAISHNINFVISLYNRAITHVVEQFASEDSLAKYPEFPEEFRKFVPQLNRENFITWEHFPDNWREKSFVNCMRDFLVQLKLPKFTFSGQVYHSRDIEKELRKYLETCLPAESIDRVTYGIMQPILATQLNETISWLRPVEIIAMEKLLVTFRGSQLPLNFVFNRDALDVYSTNPWWLKDDFLEGFSVVLDGDEPEAKKRREEMPVKLEDVLEQADKFIQKADEKLQKCQKIVKTSCEISRELDAKLNEEEENNRQMQRKWRLQLNRN
uniref:Uncharacterized protein n=1 Tax=Lutzomyia longipalpis TaxID=7200 RepID=A0A1B0CR16_LUTLO